MLSSLRKESGYAALKDVIHEITGDHNATHAEGDFAIEAHVDGVMVFQGEVKCFLQVDHYDGKISIYWEESGLTEYRQAGLFGRMSTNYQEVTKLPASVVRIEGHNPEYSIHLNYRS